MVDRPFSNEEKALIDRLARVMCAKCELIHPEMPTLFPSQIQVTRKGLNSFEPANACPLWKTYVLEAQAVVEDYRLGQWNVIAGADIAKTPSAPPPVKKKRRAPIKPIAKKRGPIVGRTARKRKAARRKPS